MFNLAEFLKAAGVNALFVMPLILGFVTYLGKLGVRGRWQLVASMATGFVLGVAAQVATVGLPVEFSGWFALFLFGFVPGLAASGVYEVGLDIGNKAAVRAALHVEEMADDDDPWLE